MKANRSTPFGRLAQRAFTLVELLAVMGIMAILLAVTVPSLAGINESLNITQGGQLVADQIALARQISSSRNITVEVRFINSNGSTAVGYYAVQLWSSSNGTAAPVSRVQKLPDGIAVSQDTNLLSTLFQSYKDSGKMPTDGPLSGDDYVSFTVNPSGMLGPLGGTPPNMTALSIGVVPARHAADAALPSNYLLVQLNPLTAATLIYRP